MTYIYARVLQQSALFKVVLVIFLKLPLLVMDNLTGAAVAPVVAFTFIVVNFCQLSHFVQLAYQAWQQDRPEIWYHTLRNFPRDCLYSFSFWAISVAIESTLLITAAIHQHKQTVAQTCLLCMAIQLACCLFLSVSFRSE